MKLKYILILVLLLGNMNHRAYSMFRNEMKSNVTILVNNKFYMGPFNNAAFIIYDKVGNEVLLAKFNCIPGDIIYDSLEIKRILTYNENLYSLYISFEIVNSKGIPIRIKKEITKDIFLDNFTIINIELKRNNYKVRYFSNSFLEKQGKRNKSIFY